MPGLSVTAIAIVVAVIATRRLPNASFRSSLLRSLAGAWVGFLIGALVGVIIDVIAGTGWWVAVVGHAAAVGGAVFAAFRLPRPSPATAAVMRDR